MKYTYVENLLWESLHLRSYIFGYIYWGTLNEHGEKRGEEDSSKKNDVSENLKSFQKLKSFNMRIFDTFIDLLIGHIIFFQSIPPFTSDRLQYHGKLIMRMRYQSS